MKKFLLKIEKKVNKNLKTKMKLKKMFIESKLKNEESKGFSRF